jgi:predicted CXXCH cytochrome family protein
VQREDFANRTEWQVLPARVAGTWFPEANFTHGRHTAMECVDCHDAPASTESNDVLMPGVDSCRDCHGGESAENQLQSTCIACHKFHSPKPEPAPRVTSFNRRDFFLPDEAPSGTLYIRDRPDVEAAAREREEPATRRRRPGEGP